MEEISTITFTDGTKYKLPKTVYIEESDLDDNGILALKILAQCFCEKEEK